MQEIAKHPVHPERVGKDQGQFLRQQDVYKRQVTHVLNMLVSKLTRADIQSTITPDEGRNVPWHIYNIEACDTAKQTLIGLDGLMEMRCV